MEFQARLHFIGLVEKVTDGRPAVEAVAAALLKISADHAVDAYSTIKERLRSEVTAPAERLSLLYVLDVACSRLAQRHATHPLLGAVLADLPDLVTAAAGTSVVAAPEAGSGPDEPTTTTAAASTLQSVLRVVSRWKNDDVFPHGQLADMERMLSAALEARKAAGSTAAVTKTDLLRAIEAEREKQKRLREDAFLRPVDDPEDGEFDELWGPVPPSTSPPSPTKRARTEPSPSPRAARDSLQPSAPDQGPPASLADGPASAEEEARRLPAARGSEATAMAQTAAAASSSSSDALPPVGRPRSRFAEPARSRDPVAAPSRTRTEADTASAPAPTLPGLTTSTPAVEPSAAAGPAAAAGPIGLADGPTMSPAGRPRIRRPRLSEALVVDQVPTPGPTPTLVVTGPASFKRPEDAGQAAEGRLTYAQEARAQTVIVWDLDETLIVFQGLARGLIGKTSVASLRKNPDEAVALHDLVEQTILRALEPDRALGSASLDQANPPHISWPTDPDVRRQLQLARDLYQQSALAALQGVLGSTALAQEWGRTYEQLNDFADDWLALAKGILEGVPATTTNVVVSSSHLLPLLIKCILFKLQRHIAVDHLYSSDRFGKLWCMEQIRLRFGTSASYVVVGDGDEERWAATQVGWPFVQWSTTTDLVAFYKRFVD